MANKKADFKLEEDKPRIINTCWICNKKFLTTYEMENPICPDCEKTKLIVRKSSNTFVKADSGKLQWSLLPIAQIEDVVKVLMIGAEKYGRDNWKNCDDTNRYKDALMRHVTSYIKGEKIDVKSKGGDGLPHLAHAICNCLFLMYFDDMNTKACEEEGSNND